MEKDQRSNLVIGIILILVGGLFLASRLIPGWNFSADQMWPLLVVGVGALLFIIGLVTRAPDMAVPACVVSGIGGILYYQNVTHQWSSWAYIWTLIPGFVGIGMLLAFVLGARERYPISKSLDTIITSLVLFCIFGFFLGPLKNWGPYAPILLIAAGVLILLRSFVRKTS